MSLLLYWRRCEYILYNFILIGLLYLFSDSLLNQYIKRDKVYLNVIFHSIQLISFIAYFLTSIKDPGWVNLNNTLNLNQQVLLNMSDSDLSELNNEPKYISVKSMNDGKINFKIINSIPKYNRKIDIDTQNEEKWPSNYCDQCNFIRPIRSKHCFFCSKCVAKYDHHCPAVGKCIGADNYRYYILFVSSQYIIIIWSLYIAIYSLYEIYNMHSRNNYHITHDIYSIISYIFGVIFVVLLFIIFFILSCLVGFHLYLIFTNQTTYEFYRCDYTHKYLLDEIKRKKTYYKRNQHASDYQYKYYGNGIKSYTKYFDQGFIKNLKMAFKGIVKQEWRTPIKVNLKH